jgi:hypothetical protein
VLACASWSDFEVLGFCALLTVWKAPLTNRVMSSSIVIRQAKHSDQNDMATIALAAMEMDPAWGFRFPLRKVFQEDTYEATRAKYQEFLENANGNWRVMIAEIKSIGQQKALPIAFAVWDVSNVGKLQIRSHTRRQPGMCMIYILMLRLLTVHPETAEMQHVVSTPAFNRRDANQSRLKAWNETMLAAKQSLFNARFGQQYFQLQILATHPQYHRLGAGTALCNWGLKMARLENLGVAVFGSPMGRELYSRLGFKMVAIVKIQTQDDDEALSLAAMVYYPVP